MWDQSQVVFMGSPEEFRQTCMNKKLIIDGNVFFTEDSVPFDNVRRPTSVHEARVMYHELLMDRIKQGICLTANVCDLEQRPPFGSLSQTVPTMADASMA